MISAEEFVERLCLVAAARGPRRFPRSARDRAILMKSIRLGIDPRRTYREPDVNALLQGWLHDVAPALDVDHVTLRRLLVDYGHLERTADGRGYRLGYPSRPLAFALDVDEVDVRATIAAFRAHEEQRRRASRARARPTAR
jgi:hypothetical protein